MKTQSLHFYLLAFVVFAAAPISASDSSSFSDSEEEENDYEQPQFIIAEEIIIDTTSYIKNESWYNHKEKKKLILHPIDIHNHKIFPSLNILYNRFPSRNEKILMTDSYFPFIVITVKQNTRNARLRYLIYHLPTGEYIDVFDSFSKEKNQLTKLQTKYIFEENNSNWNLYKFNLKNETNNRPLPKQ